MDSEDHKMTPGEWQLFNRQVKLDRVLEKNRYYCHCGHSVTIKPKENRIFCTHCGHWVYKDKKKQRWNVYRIEKENQKRKNELKKINFINKLKEAIEKCSIN